MEPLPILLSFVETLKQAHKICLKNGRLMISIASFAILLHSSLFLANFFSLRPLTADLIAKQALLLVTSPTSGQYAKLLTGVQEDVRFFVGLEWAFVVAYSICSVLFSTATIYASAVTYVYGTDKSPPSMKDLALTTARSWRRPLITYIYILLLGVGYIVLALFIVLPLTLARESLESKLLCVAAALLYAYLSVVWSVGVVVSVLEDKSGIEALGKAGQLVKGMELHGFLLSLVITALCYGVEQVLRLVSFGPAGSSGTWTQVAVSLVVVNSLWLVRMFGLMGYTVFYGECKKLHEEKIDTDQLTFGLNYTKIGGTMPLVSENLP